MKKWYNHIQSDNAFDKFRTPTAELENAEDDWVSEQHENILNWK